tara:strand:- start:155 stop:565 length:411 start_codon:yes stop_codon:yes gene_type:complete
MTDATLNLAHALTMPVEVTKWSYTKKTYKNYVIVLTDLEKAVLNLYPIECFNEFEYGGADPADVLLDFDEVVTGLKKQGFNLKVNQVKGIISSLSKKGAIEIEVRGETAAEKRIFGQDLYWLNKEWFIGLGGLEDS